MKEQFLSSVSYIKQEGEKPRRVKEDYIVKADSFTEVEMNISKELQHLIDESFVIQSIKRDPIEGFFQEFADVLNTWYRIKIQTLDPESDKEKYIKSTYFVNASDTGKANDIICDELAGDFQGFSVISIIATNVVDKF